MQIFFGFKDNKKFKYTYLHDLKNLGLSTVVFVLLSKLDLS